jgi:hypothetical protein
MKTEFTSKSQSIRLLVTLEDCGYGGVILHFDGIAVASIFPDGIRQYGLTREEAQKLTEKGVSLTSEKDKAPVITLLPR